MNGGNQHRDTAADGRGCGGVKSGKLGTRHTMRNMRQRRPEMERSRSAPDARDARRGRRKEGGRKVGYHSGSRPLEIAAPMPPLPLPASTLPPSLLSAPRRRYIFSPPPKKKNCFKALQRRGKVGRDCLGELIRRSRLCESKLRR